MIEVIKKADGERVQNLSHIHGIDNGKMEEIISYSQLVDHLVAADDPATCDNEDNEISDDLYKFRALIGHQGPVKATDPNWKGCKYNVLVDWETGEKTYEPLSVLAAKDQGKIIQILNEDYKLKVKRDGPLSHHFGADYSRDKDKTLVCQPKKYVDRLLES